MAEAFTLYKLIILYMLDKVDFPLTNSQISEFVLDKGYTDYFKLQQALSELADGGLILKESTHNRTLFHLTEDGKGTIHLFRDKISKPIQDDIDHFLQTKQYDLKNEVSVKADYMKNAGEEYSVRCQVFENHEPLIDLTLSVPTEYEAHLVAKDRGINLVDITLSVPVEETAAAICDNWQKKNQVVYAWLMSQLL